METVQPTSTMNGRLTDIMNRNADYVDGDAVNAQQ